MRPRHRRPAHLPLPAGARLQQMTPARPHPATNAWSPMALRGRHAGAPPPLPLLTSGMNRQPRMKMWYLQKVPTSGGITRQPMQTAITI